MLGWRENATRDSPVGLRSRAHGSQRQRQRAASASRYTLYAMLRTQAALLEPRTSNRGSLVITHDQLGNLAALFCVAVDGAGSGNGVDLEVGV